MRILHLATHCRRGFGNVHVGVDLACVQAQNGHTVAFASGGGTYVDLLGSYGVDHVMFTQNIKNPFSAVASVARLGRLCATFRPDVIHAHMNPAALLGYMVGKAMRVPLVNTVHNSFDRTSYVMRFGDRVVAVSNPEKEFLLQRGFPADRLDVVTNGPNGTPREHTKLEAEDAESIEIEKPAVITVCGLHKRKGIDFLIRAFDQATTAHPQWRLYIAGWGPDYDKLIALSDELGLKDRVILLRYVANPKPLLAQSDIFVLASLAEPGALSIGEARGAGCAVIGTKVGGIPEQLEYGRAGTLVEPANVEQLTEALRALMDDPAKLAEAKARALANSERFDIRRVVTDYDEVYRRAITSFKRPVPVEAT